MTAHPGERFDDRDPLSGRFEVPSWYYHQPVLRKALASHDFGIVFRRLRADFHLTQEALGELVDLPQKRISEVENRKLRLRYLHIIIRITTALRIPAELLGFVADANAKSGEEVGWMMDRRNFVHTVVAITLGANTFPGLDRLTWLHPEHDNPAIPQRIGANDVQAITDATAMFRNSDHKHGGGLLRAAAKEHLRHVLRLKDVRCTDQVRASLQLAVAEIAMTAAWMSYDVEEHDDARRLWLFALNQARTVQDPRTADLAVDVYLDMAHQALHLDEYGEALKLVQLARMVADSHDYPISDSTRSYLSTNMAWCRGAQGQADACRREMDSAQQSYLNADLTAAPTWASHLVPAEIAAQRGHALFLLSHTDRANAAEAIEHLHTAVSGYGTTYTRSRALNLPGLATCYFYAGDVQAGVRTGLAAITAISGLSSRRAYTRLTKLSKTAGMFANHPDVAELRAQIAQTVATT
ncbi:helix-turn-helix domain-containing protein [Lentzea sp. NPDC059081]|uniref:helix-turn-helix domain-containing protein n=1 Tax=Lentzea sp. NPDC059081 TaxID=3346719 RepID=UPI0036B183D3